MTMTEAAGWVGAATSILAAGFWLAASLVKVPNDLDNFIDALQRGSRLNAIGAGFACASALCAAYLFGQSAL